ncbi:MAG: PsiF family protein [Lysobacteraceae bacterium]
MKSSIIAISAAAMLAFGIASAATTPAAATSAKPMTAQQTKMGTCAHANKGKKGAEYKAAMSACLKGGAAAPMAAMPMAAAPAAPMAAAPAAAAPMTQQNKMKSCNADAGKQKLKGDARKAFMSGCLKKAA